MQNSGDIPSGYGDNRIVLMVRDPWTIYSYWEVNESLENSIREKIQTAGLAPSKSILRLYEVTGKGTSSELKIAFDIELKNRANNWYIRTGTNGGRWMVDIGILCTNGEFFRLAQSNAVTAPYGGTSVAVGVSSSYNFFTLQR
jgi:hypothetical protein